VFSRNRSIDNVDDLVREHGARLRELVGARVESAWLAWDASRDEWFADEAVIVRTEITTLEIVCWRLSDIMLSWGEIDTTLPPRWVGDWGPEFDLVWRRDATATLQRAVGQDIVGVCVIEHLHRTVVLRDRRTPANVESWLLHGIEIELGEGVLSIFNALDENGISAERVTGADFRRTRAG
jgi:hypothetical protein